MRYHKNISINFDVDIENEDLKLIPLLFIILVENAFKHGVEVLRDNAFVNISIISNQNAITLNVKNNFDTKEQSHEGIGLENLKRRLELAYSKKYEFTHTINDDIYTAKLKLTL